MTEEATEELENTTPEVEAETSSETEASPIDEKLETGDKTDEKKLEDGDIDKNQYYALKRLANKNRKVARQLAKENADLEEKLAQASKPQAPKVENYENYDDYIKAAVDYGVAQQTPTEPQYDHAASVRDDLMEAGKTKYPDFDKVAFATKEMLKSWTIWTHPKTSPTSSEKTQTSSNGYWQRPITDKTGTGWHVSSVN